MTYPRLVGESYGDILRVQHRTKHTEGGRTLSTMKLFLDDRRELKPGFDRLARTAGEAIELLKSGTVTDLSLDHDLGGQSTGMEVLNWIQRQMAETGFVPPEVMVSHSANPAGKAALERAIESIRRQEARGT